MSALVVLNERFEPLPQTQKHLQQQGQQGQQAGSSDTPFPGLVTTLDVVTDRAVEDNAQKLLAYGGNVYQRHLCGNVYGCAKLHYVSFVATLPPGVTTANPAAGVFATPTLQTLGDFSSDAAVIGAAMFHVGKATLHALLLYSPATTASPAWWRVAFVNVATSGSGGGGATLNCTWTLLQDGTPPLPPLLPESGDVTTGAAPVRLDMAYHYAACHPSAAKRAFALGGFYTRAVCEERPELVLITPTSVLVYLVQDLGRDRTIDLSRDTLARFYGAPPGRVVVDATLFGNQIPPLTFSTLGNTTAILNSGSSTSLPVSSQTLWLAVATKGPSPDDAQQQLSQLWVIALPEFAYAHLNSTIGSVTNPTALPAACAAQCAQASAAAPPLPGWGSFYCNVAAAGQCERREAILAYESTQTHLAQVEVRWRDIPGSMHKQFAAMKCAPMDIQCITAFAAQAVKSPSLPFAVSEAVCVGMYT